MAVYYNENDPSAAQWLRNLIESGLLPNGDVDDRSITEVEPKDLGGYSQCHFFAGIGGWPLALQMAGWPQDRQVWTGSCPCQPFSIVGNLKGKQDERHLWPEFRRLIEQFGPPRIFGEQVASKAGRSWWAGVQTDLEALGYGAAAADLCAAGVGAPHIRQRLFWVGHTVVSGLERHTGHDNQGQEPGRIDQSETGSTAKTGGSDSRLDWDRCDWIEDCYGKTRRIPEAESGAPLLVDGVSPFVAGLRSTAETTSVKEALRGLGNAIVPPLAGKFIEAYMESQGL